MLAVLALLGAAVVAAAVAWRVPQADEALVVTGWRTPVVRRQGTFVWAGVQRCCRVDLALHDLRADVEVTASEGIDSMVTLRESWRIRSDEASILDAARHVARQPGLAERQVHGSVAARLRAAVGAAPAAALLDRGGAGDLAATVATGTATDIGAWGTVLDGLAICAVEDRTGYLADLTRPRLAQASSAARIAVAAAEAEAVEAEQRATRAASRARHDTASAGGVGWVGGVGGVSRGGRPA